MQSKWFFLSLLILAIIFLGACQTTNLSTDPDQAAARSNDVEASLQLTLPEPETNKYSCVNPVSADKKLCDAYEEQILASVVRLEVKGPSRDNPDQDMGGIAHGTVKNGRYLVVHNHFGVDLTVFAEDYYPGYASVRMYRTNGRLVLMGAGPPLFDIVLEDAQTLVLDFGADDSGVGFFDQFEIPSAEFASWGESSLQPGVEVAQVVWDGENTHIEWVAVDEVVIDGKTPQLILKNQIESGSSGGGIFLNGYHVANNWMSVEFASEGRPLNDLFSIAALNSERVAITGQQ